MVSCHCEGIALYPQESRLEKPTRDSGRIAQSRATWLALLLVIGLTIFGFYACAQQVDLELSVYDTGPSIQGDDGAILSMPGVGSWYVGPDSNQGGNPVALRLSEGTYGLTLTAVWPQQTNIDGTCDECRYGRCQNLDIATFYIQFDGYPSFPVAVNDFDSTQEDTPIDVDVLENDSASARVFLDGAEHTGAAFRTEILRRRTGPCLDGDCCGFDYPESQSFELTVDTTSTAIFVSSVQATSDQGGTVVGHNAFVTYTPASGFCGTDSFTYTISDGNGGSDTATVTINVSCVNDGPTANDDQGSTPEDTPVTVDVLANDTDPENDPLTVIGVTQPSHGSVTNNGNDVTYTPNADFCGSDSFTYTISDGNGGSDTATVIIDVSCQDEIGRAHV